VILCSYRTQLSPNIKESSITVYHYSGRGVRPFYGINIKYKSYIRQSINHISENGFEATFCVLSIICSLVLVITVTGYSDDLV